MAVRSVAALCGAAGVALVALSGAASADEFTYTFNLDGTSDYVFRGFSQSARDPAMQGGADFAYNIFYAGIWASSIDFGTDREPMPCHRRQHRRRGGRPVRRHRAHLEELAVRRRDLQPRFHLLLVSGQPTLPRTSSTARIANIDYLEGKAGYSVAWKQIKGLTTGETIYYSGDGTFNTGRVLDAGRARPPIRCRHWGPVTPSISGTWGYDQGESGNAILHSSSIGNGKDNYQYWNAGVTFTVDKISLDLRYWDTDVKDDNAAAADARRPSPTSSARARSFQCDANFVATVKVVLP